jgi:hypothetical protein
MASKIKHEKTWYMVIDVTLPETTRLLKITDVRRAPLWGAVYKDDGLQVIAPSLDGRGFAKLDKLQLQYFYWNVCQQTPPDEYGDLVKACLTVLDNLEKDSSSEEELLQEIHRRGIDRDAPSTSKKKPAEESSGGSSSRPAGGTTTGLVWELADLAFAQAGNQMPDRKVVIDACLAEEINPATASTQYAKWAKAKRASIGI